MTGPVGARAAGTPAHAAAGHAQAAGAHGLAGGVHGPAGGADGLAAGRSGARFGSDAGPRERRSEPAPNQKGSGTVLTAAAILVAALVAAALLVVAGYVAAVHHARASADLVALSAAAAQARGESACRVAAALAVANGVRLRGCRVHGDSLDFAVVVVVERAVAAPPRLPGSVTATATAGRIGLLP